MSRTEAAMRRAGALLALAAASALITRMSAAVPVHVALPLHAVLLLGCAAVQLAPAHRAVAGLARRAAEAAARTTALGASTAGMRWAGFAGVVVYAIYMTGDVRTEAALHEVGGFLLYLMFLAGVWAVYLSMVTGSRAAPPPRLAAAAEEEELDGGEVDAMAPRPARVVVDPKL